MTQHDHTPHPDSHPPDSEEGAWEPCAPGELTSLVSDLKRRRRRHEWVRGGTLVGLALILLSTAFWFGRSDSTAKMTCRELVPMLAKYDQGQLSATEEDRVEAHLRRCPECREHYERMRDANQTWRRQTPEKPEPNAVALR